MNHCEKEERERDGEKKTIYGRKVEIMEEEKQQARKNLHFFFLIPADCYDRQRYHTASYTKITQLSKP